MTIRELAEIASLIERRPENARLLVALTGAVLGQDGTLDTFTFSDDTLLQAVGFFADVLAFTAPGTVAAHRSIAKCLAGLSRDYADRMGLRSGAVGAAAPTVQKGGGA